MDKYRCKILQDKTSFQLTVRIIFLILVSSIHLDVSALPETENIINFPEASDDELVGMRGRYASNGMVINFGVEMVSTWRTVDNVTIESSVRLQVDSQLRPSLTVSYVDAETSNSHAQARPNTTISGAGLSNITGVVQSIQIGGDGNDIKNDIQLALSTTGAGPSTVGNTLTQSGIYTSDLHAGHSTITVKENSLTMDLDVPGQGRTVQRLSAGGIFQQATVTSDLNRIRNQVNLTARIRPGMGVSRYGSVLGALRGLRQIGAM